MTTLFDQDYITELYGNEREKEGIKEGIKEGKKEGLEIGEKNKAIEIAKKMIDSGMNKQEIIKYTGITEEELKDL